MRIEVRSLHKSFGNLPVLRDVSLEVCPGELVALLGPSGCGKTTLLRIIAGLEFADQGSVLFEGQEVGRRSVRDRRLGFVFQHYALFRHMTVFENVAFGLRVRPRASRPSGREIHRRVMELLGLVKLEAQAGHLPLELSGGQRQRVALARALAVEPRVLLLDEPFGSLDAQVRRELRGWLRRLHDELHLTSLFVTHDQEEALELADRVAVMHQGRIIQVGTPFEVYSSPADHFVYNFLGSVNLFHGRFQDGQVLLGDVSLPIPGGASPQAGDGPARPEERSGWTGPALRDGPVHVYVRPHMLEISSGPADPPAFRARIRHIHAAGPTVKVELVSEWGESLFVEMSHERFSGMSLASDREVYVRAAREHFFVAQAPEVGS